jgi:dTDP-4-amino-4,6-dideoxygalactose transaminase
MQELQQVSRYSLAWQAQGPGGPLQAPTLLCMRLPDEGVRATVEHACQQARVMTRRWYQPLLQHMTVLQQRCLVLDTPDAQLLAQTLLGLPFFLGMTQLQRHRILSVISSQ